MVLRPASQDPASILELAGRLLDAYELEFRRCVAIVEPQCVRTRRTDEPEQDPRRAVERVQRWADQRIPDHIRDQIRIEFDATDRTITIRECRPPWHPDMGDEWTRFRDKSSLRSIYRQRGSGRYA